MPTPAPLSGSELDLRARMLSDASKAFAESGLELDSVLAEVVRRVTGCLGDICAIRILTPDGRSLVAPAFFARDPEITAMLRDALARPLASDEGESAEVLRTGRAIVVAAVDPGVLARRYPRTEVAALLARYAPSAMMIAPLRTRGRAFGTLTVSTSAATGAGYTSFDLAFLQELADRAALAIENAELYRLLKDSDDKLHLAMEAGRLGVFEWDIVTGRVFWSPSLEDTHGIPRGSFAATFEAFQRDIHPEDRARVLAAIDQVVRERAHHHLEYRIIRPDGEVRWLESNARLHCDAEGRPARLLGICSDVTDRKRTEDRLARTLRSLTEADRRKDQFLAMLAHELRNPLAPMVHALELLAPGPGARDRDVRAFEILGRQVQHMTRLVDDLLDVSRVSRGKIELAREPLDLRRVVREVVFDHDDGARARGIGFEVELSDEPCRVDGDSIRLAQVIGNVVGNAIKFSSSGQTIRIAVELDRDGWPTVRVRDEGVGIASELLPCIFEPFTQADADIDRRHGGLGLGLAVARGLVELHGGRVTADSAGVGTGTEVSISLPACSDVVEVARPPAIATTGPSLRILVIEDNADAAEMLSELLLSAGHCVEVDRSGIDAARVAARFRPNVILCDLGLPGKTGFEVAAELRLARETEHVRLIALSGYGSDEDRHRTREAGFDLHLVKPVVPETLLTLLADGLC
ncbi:MAG: chemotaxis protein methyltransferase CheR [Deltaproteobacteria bacterium]|nr:chemotaxis protein methyltransferase CheR [Deltaproteobacteria bacterium]